MYMSQWEGRVHRSTLPMIATCTKRSNKLAQNGRMARLKTVKYEKAVQMVNQNISAELRFMASDHETASTRLQNRNGLKMAQIDTLAS